MEAVRQVGKKGKALGATPSVLLINPKHKANVGAALRAASCFGVKQLFWTGDRVTLDVGKGERLPREERMKGYKDVEMVQTDYPFDCFPEGTTPVAVEVRENAELLPTFVHPPNPLYVFGPEDGGLTRVHLKQCHRFVIIPTRHCVNLSAAVYMMLYDRHAKRLASGEEPTPTSYEVLAESRGWAELDDDHTLEVFR